MKHKHSYKLGKSKTVKVCRCGAFRHVGPFTPIVEQRAVTLRIENPQKNYKLINDVPTYCGDLEMFTILTDFYDRKGYNRKHSTFTRQGLEELNITPENCKLVPNSEVTL